MGRMYVASVDTPSTVLQDYATYFTITTSDNSSTPTIVEVVWGNGSDSMYWSPITINKDTTATISYRGIDLANHKEAWKQFSYSPPDTTPPAISVFNVSPPTTTLGLGFTINYTVSDSGGSGLKQAALWRANIDGSATDSSWRQIGSAVALSGNGPYSSTFSDTPTAVGNYWYGIHVIDNANNYMDERIAGLGPKEVTVTSPDTTPPTPNPSTWATGPHATGTTSISMTATTASDPSGVQYYFHCLTTGGHDSGWQASPTYVDTGLSPNTTYTYQVMTRDNSPNQNQGSYSASAAATTQQVANNPPQLSGIAMTNGVFRFVLNGPVGSNYVIQVSSNLMNWSAISTNTIPAGGSTNLSDPSVTNKSRRFYRAVPVAGVVAGRIVAWGSNSYGQTNAPVGTNWTAVAGGYYHSLALKADGTVVGWGQNDDFETNVPASLSNVTAIAAGWGTSLALKSDGTLRGWGWDGGYAITNTANSMSNITAISACWDCLMALRTNGTVTVWGHSTYGETNVPAGLNNVVAIAGGGYFCMALKGDGTVVVWGSNFAGQTNVPTGLSSVKAIAAVRQNTLPVGHVFNMSSSFLRPVP